MIKLTRHVSLKNSAFKIIPATWPSKLNRQTSGESSSDTVSCDHINCVPQVSRLCLHLPGAGRCGPECFKTQEALSCQTVDRLTSRLHAQAFFTCTVTYLSAPNLDQISYSCQTMHAIGSYHKRDLGSLTIQFRTKKTITFWKRRLTEIAATRSAQMNVDPRNWPDWTQLVQCKH
jgi:hypothetical protein